MGHELQIHFYWYTKLKAIFDTSAFLQWHSAYDDVTETQAHTKLHFELNVTLDRPTGHGQYTDPLLQSMIGLHAHCQQVSGLAFKAL